MQPINRKEAVKMQKILKIGLGLITLSALAYGLWLTLDTSTAKAFAANMTLGVARGLPKTGQTTSYETGDDGTYQKGWSGTRFTNNTDGTITDNATGLMWVQDGTGLGCNGGVGLAWAAAIAFAEGLGFAGYSDWRLPNVKELQSIVDYGTYNPAIDSVFTNTQSDSYWSSTTYAGYAGYAWRVNFNGGYVYDGGKDYDYYVRPVRGGQ